MGTNVECAFVLRGLYSKLTLTCPVSQVRRLDPGGVKWMVDLFGSGTKALSKRTLSLRAPIVGSLIDTSGDLISI